MTGVTEEMAIAAAKAELEFDGRSWMGVSRSDRERYVARARVALSSVIGEGDVVVRAWASPEINLSEREREFLRRVRDGGPLGYADREEDKARQRMRKLGFARVPAGSRKWVITTSGLSALSQKDKG